MSIAELSVRRPVTVVMVYAVICIVAAVFIPRLGIAMFPSTTFPVVSVSTTYSNASPEIIDTTVTQVIANQLSGIIGVKNITSTSNNGSSNIRLEFGYDADLDEAASNIESALSRISRSLPSECGTPMVMRFDSSSGGETIMRLAVQGNLPINELKTVAEDTISPLLERIEGVAQVDVMGGSAKRVYVKVAQDRLAAYGISPSSVSSALSARNVQMSAGSITQEGRDYEILTSEYFTSLDDIRNTTVTTLGGVPVKVSDVADVYESFDVTGRKVYINGEQSMYVSITSESGTNGSTVARAVANAMDGINEQLPSGVSLSVISDNTTMINATMQQVYISAIEGAVLAMLVIFIFLRNIRSSIIIGLSIPICFLITLTCMAIMGLTVNMMTMAGLILGMGMVVDSSIVVLENIYNHRVAGERSAIAAILGSRNMINAIVASTLTTLCVFVPMLIYKAELEMLGQMFYELVVTVCISLVASLIVAVTLVPALCGSIWPISSRTQKPLKFKPLKVMDDFADRLLKGLENAYVSGLKFCLHNRFLVLTLVLSILVYTAVLFTGFGMNMAPQSNSDDQVSVSISLPIGTTNSVVMDYLFQFQEFIKEECAGAYKSIVINSGSGNSGSIQINLPELTEQTMSPTEIRAKLTPHLKEWSDVTVSFSSGRGPGGGGSAISVELQSNDATASRATADEIVEILREHVPQVTEPKTDFENGKPRFRMVINTEAAAAAGVSVNAIASEIRACVSGITATTYYKDGNRYSVIVELPDVDLENAGSISSLYVNTGKGRMQLSNFLTYEQAQAPQRIQRENNVRINHVTAGLASGTTTTEAQAAVEAALTAYLVLPETVTISYGGDARSIQQFGGAFVTVIILAVLLVFAVMAAQFESMVDPFIIFFSIPLLVIGVVAVYKITGQAFTLYSVVGIVALVGVVVNNGIVLVDYTNQLVDKKTPVYEACLEAGRNRLRPILMSTLTTVLGMVPMAFFPGEGAESMQPVCVTMVGGMLSGSIMTLFVSPIMYTLLNKRREKRFDNPDALINQLADLDSGLIAR